VSAAVGTLLGALVGAAVLGALVPAAIARLPEPAPEQLPEDEADDSALERMLREEGPKELYADLARRPWLRPSAVVLSGLSALLAAVRLGDQPVTWVAAALAPALVLLAIVDWRTRLLPRVVVLPTTGVLLALVVIEWVLTRDTAVLVRAIVAMVVARSLFWLLWFIRRAGMGFGDVRLAALLGLALGRLGWNVWLLGLYGGLLLFGVFGIGLMVVRRDRSTLRRAYPFGPFMVAGALLGILVGQSVSLVG